MNNIFAPIDANKKYEMVINQLEALILAKELKKGDKLPTEKELTELLGVSRNSIREAISALTILGIVEKNNKGGTVITCNSIQGVCRPMALTYRLDGGNTFDILSFRYILEIQLVKLLIAKCNNDDFELLGDILQETIEANNEKELLDSDVHFHHQLANMTKNKLISYFEESIQYIIEAQMIDSHLAHYNMKKDFNAVKDWIYKNHMDILSGLKQKDVVMAVNSIVSAYEITYPDYDFSAEKQCK